MRISAKPVINYCNVNSFTTGNQWTIRSGEQNTLIFQLVDLDKSDLRYIPGVGVDNQPVQVSVTFPSIDDGVSITVPAIQVSSDDASLWQVSLSPGQIPASGNVLFSIMEGGKIKRFNVINMIMVELVGNGNDGSC